MDNIENRSANKINNPSGKDSSSCAIFENPDIPNVDPSSSVEASVENDDKPFSASTEEGNGEYFK